MSLTPGIESKAPILTVFTLLAPVKFGRCPVLSRDYAIRANILRTNIHFIGPLYGKFPSFSDKIKNVNMFFLSGKRCFIVPSIRLIISEMLLWVYVFLVYQNTMSENGGLFLPGF